MDSSIPLPKRNENRCSQKDVYKNVHSSLIHYNPNLESAGAWITKYGICISRTLHSNKKE